MGIDLTTIGINYKGTQDILKKGNSKTGGTYMLSYGMLPGDDDVFIEKLGMNVTGTCCGVCDGCKYACYAMQGRYKWKSVKLGNAVRALLAKYDRKQFEKQVRKEIEKGIAKGVKYVRIHTSGEFFDLEYLELWLTIARDYPEITFYTYSKQYILFDYVLTCACGLPENFVLNVSIWCNDGIEFFNKWKHLDNIKAFVYLEPGFDYAKVGLELTQCHCPGYDKNGKNTHRTTCENCKVCICKLKSCKIIFCYPHK